MAVPTVTQAYSNVANYADLTAFTGTVLSGVNISGTNRKACVLAIGTMRNNITNSCSLGGVTMNPVQSVINTDSSYRPQLFYFELLEADMPAGTTADIAITFTGGQGGISVLYQLLTNAEQSYSTVVDTQDDGATTGSSMTLSGTTTADALITSMMEIENTDGDPSITETGDQDTTVRIYNGTTAAYAITSETDTTGGRTTTHSWSYDAGCKGVGLLVASGGIAGSASTILHLLNAYYG